MSEVGLRKERVTFQQRSLDENGDRLGDWEPGFRWSARCTARIRGEEITAQRIQGIQPVDVVVLRRDKTEAVTTAWRMLWKGVAYNIKAIAPSEDRADFLIMAEADQSDA